ncbi:hypothetical protein IAT38_002692 [Cryptococcus sp. DSM 104549]
MYIPNVQSIITAGLALTGAASNVVSSGKVLDFAVEKCIDKDKNVRCSKPFPVTKSTCYQIKWTTDGKISHTTAEVRDAGSDEIVFYRDTDGEWTSEKNELVYLDFKPKVWGQGNNTVEYEVSTCE